MKIKLPELAFIHKGRIGFLKHVLFPSREVNVISVSEIQVTQRIKEKLFELETGEKVIITTKKRVCPDGVDAILIDDCEGNFRWQEHRALNKFISKVEQNDWEKLLSEISKTWKHSFKYKSEERQDNGKIIPGLRCPQLGALHSIGSHWSISKSIATITMPTGTGKTETMLASLVEYINLNNKLLVIVPNKALLEQTALKFLTLGKLRELGNIPEDVNNPIVAIIKHQPKSIDDLNMISHCHVAITTPNAISHGNAIEQLSALAEKFTHLIVDEAHHVPSKTWTAIREAFESKQVIQFTATPWRSDGKPIEGKNIYNYPLRQAQEDGYFKKIIFSPILCLDESNSDRSLAVAGIDQLKLDIEQRKKNHILMARCNSIERAEVVFKNYSELGSEYNPVLIHSKSDNVENLILSLRNGTSKILVCVNMFGEGFDLPELKIAVVHDSQKSIAPLLQFIGRFTRTSGDNIGEATVIANIANDDFSDALKALFSEDADWNRLLSEYSSDAMRTHIELTEFLRNCKRLDEETEDEETAAISPSSITPKFSVVSYRTNEFSPEKFHKALEGHNFIVKGAWHNERENVLFFITKSNTPVQWGRSKSLKDRSWNLFVVYYNLLQKNLFVNTSDPSIKLDAIARSIGGDVSTILDKDIVFRSLGNINRLMFQQVGLKKHGGRRNLRYSMYSGTDVRTALSPAQTANSTKSNVSGGGFEDGQPVTIGCSYKGRIWSKEKGSIKDFISWCDKIGDKLNDMTIDTDKIIDNVLIPKPIGALPDKNILCIDWPIELLQKQEDQVQLLSTNGDFPFSQYEIKLNKYDQPNNEILFEIKHDTHSGIYKLYLSGETDSVVTPPNFHVIYVEGTIYEIKIGSQILRLDEWLCDYPPEILFVDGDELMGCDLIELSERETTPFPVTNIESIDWNGIDITKESMWKDGALREDSIQFKTYKLLQDENFDLIFNDDGSGEAADLIGIKEENDHIKLKLVHCKFSGGSTEGHRAKDLIEVCSQAIRSSRWIWRFSKLCKHLISRETRLGIQGQTSRFLKGNTGKLKHLQRANQFKEVRTEIIIVQPGASKNSLTDNQLFVLSSSHSYLLDTVNIGLKMISSN